MPWCEFEAYCRGVDTGPNDDETVEDRASDNPVIDLRDGAGWESNLAHEDFGDSEN